MSLFEDLRQHPTDRALREILRDHLLEQEDPRGALQVAELAKEPQKISKAFAACVKRVLTMVPFASRMRLHNGLVTHIEIPLEHLHQIEPDFFAQEPLACVDIVAEHEKPEQWRAWKREAHQSLAGARGLGINFTPDDEEDWLALAALFEAVQAPVLMLPGAKTIPQMPWPWVTHARLGSSDLKHTRSWVEHLDQLHTLCILPSDEEQADWIESVQEASLKLLDIRGHVLGDQERDAIHKLPYRVRHESVDLRALDSLDDVFGAQGRVWSADQHTLDARCAVVSNSEDYVLARDKTLFVYNEDSPSWTKTMSSKVTALASSKSGFLVGMANGLVQHCSADKEHELVDVVKLRSGVVRIDTEGDDILVTHKRGSWLRRAGNESLQSSANTLALGADGPIEVAGSELRVGEWSHELGEPIHEVAASGKRILVHAGERLWLINGDTKGQLSDCRQVEAGVDSARLSLCDDIVAWLRESWVTVIRAEGRATSLFSSYTGGGSGNVQPADVAARDDGTVLVVHEKGGANLLLAESAMKLDEFDFEPHRSWIFLHNGTILIAG
jgi:hypothetical protein